MKYIGILLLILMCMFAFSSCQNETDKDASNTEKVKESMLETNLETISENEITESLPSEDETDETQVPETESQPTESDGILAINPDDYYKCVVFELPEGNFRDVAVDYMREQASVEWVCENGFSVVDKFEYWSIGLEYKKGVTYHGITYTNVKSSMDEFMMFYSDGKVNMESGGSNDVVGNGCFSSTQNATQQFDPTVAGTTDVIMPGLKTFEAKIVGSYKVPENIRRTEQIISANGNDAMYAAYAELKKGDLIIQKDIDKGMSHVRMLVEDANIYTNASGKVIPSRSFVKTIEQTNAFDKTRTDGVNTTWYVDHIYTFSTLVSTNYVPVTLESYSKDRSEMEKPYLYLDSEIKPEILAKKTFSSTVKSNFPIRFVKIDILDKSGNVVASKMKNNMDDSRSVTLRNSFTSLFNGVPAGDYTLVLNAGISRGSAEFARVDFSLN